LYKKLLIALMVLFELSALGLSGDRPNIVFIVIDDMGWSDLGCYGNQVVETPRIDQLASEGVRFTDFYAAGAVCSPTRCAIQSGQNQARIGITDFIPGHWRPFERVITPRPRGALPTEIFTIAEALRATGYSTGYIGKWHLGNDARYQPDRQGYEVSQVINGPHLPGRYRVQGRSAIQPEADQYRTDFEAQLSIDFIKKSQRESKPFFLMLSPYAVHIPLAAMSDKVKKYREKSKAMNRKLPHPVYAAMIEHCDEMVGKIVDAIDECGLTQKTMIVFTSDNGGLIRRYDYQKGIDDIVSDLSPLKGEKGSLHEGGVRVPLIIKYPPMARSGMTCSEPGISYDFYPTFVDVAGSPLPENQIIDGQSLLPLVSEPTSKLDRQSLFWHYPHYHHDRPASSIRERNWKLIEYLDGSGDLELYDLSKDIGERKNLADIKQGRVTDLRQKLRQFRLEVVAAMPLPNPAYDSGRSDDWWNSRTNKPIASAARKRFPATEFDSSNNK
jgi:arylsulfatase A